MADTDTRVRCPWCMTQVNADASICQGCGAVRAKPPVSTLQLFFLYPLAAFCLMLTALGGFGMPFIHSMELFAAAWAVLALIHIALHQRRQWMQVEPLLLEDEKADDHLAYHAPAGWAPWWAGAATVATGLVVIWAISPRVTGFEPESSSVVMAISSASASVPDKVPAPVVAAASRDIAPASATPATVTTPVTPVSVASAVATPAAVAPVSTTPVNATSTDMAAIVPPRDLLPPKSETPKSETLPADKTLILSTQRLLDSLGYSVGTIDGKPGAKTRAAVKTFREQMRLGGGEEIDTGLVAALQAFSEKMGAAPTTQQVELKAPARTAESKPQPRVEQPPPRIQTMAPPQAEVTPVQQAEVNPAPQPDKRIPPLSEIRQLQQAQGTLPATATMVSNETQAASVSVSQDASVPLRSGPIRLH